MTEETIDELLLSINSVEELMVLIENRGNPVLVMVLKELDIFRNFCLNCYKYSQQPANLTVTIKMIFDDDPISSYDQILYGPGYRISRVSDAFNWADTPEGFDFWSDVDDAVVKAWDSL